jgi:hypothetical protein
MVDGLTSHAEVLVGLEGWVPYPSKEDT